MTLAHLRRMGWVSLILMCTALFLVLSFRVNAVKTEVRLAEKAIVALEERKMHLETEFQTRANQTRLAAWNAVDFGYVPPGAEQFVDGEQGLARFGMPRAVGAPEPMMVARAEGARDIPEFPAMVSPLSGEALASSETDAAPGAVSAAERSDLSADYGAPVARVQLSTEGAR